MNPIASTPAPPYFAVLFTSVKSSVNDPEYAVMAARMAELAAQQPGYLGMEHAGNSDGIAITVSYWASLEAIRNWRQHAEHLHAQRLGRAKWYERFALRVCRVERADEFAFDQ